MPQLFSRRADTILRAALAGLLALLAVAVLLARGVIDPDWFSPPAYGSPQVAWNRVQPLPRHVYFHHGIHVSRGIGCATCHGPVETMERLYPVREFSMQWCLDCHRDPAPTLAATGIEPARLDHCYVCHR